MRKHRHPQIKGLVIKVASRCNLNCSYCYVYNQGDTTYQLQPRFMSGETVSLLLKRVGDYCRRHRSRTFRFIFHGGEPLLAPVSFYYEFVEKVTSYLPTYTAVSYFIQTNGVLLTDRWCQVLGELNIQIGISLDGDPQTHDKYRIDHKGRGSYEATIQGLRKAQTHKAIRYEPGILVVIDPTSDPASFLEQMVRLKISSLNLLFPDGTHTNRPPHLPLHSLETPYADWLVQVFDKWLQLPVSERPSIRLFQQLINLILGFTPAATVVGRKPGVFLVIETDGSIEAEDSLKVCQPGITKEGQHLQTHTLESALAAPLVTQCAHSRSVLPTNCLPCPIRNVCGGGFVVHRYHPENGFDNPSVYCRDLLRLITHIQTAVLATLPASLVESYPIRPLRFEQALEILSKSNGES